MCTITIYCDTYYQTIISYSETIRQFDFDSTIVIKIIWKRNVITCKLIIGIISLLLQ